MSIFSKIKNAIFGQAEAAPASTPAAEPAAAPVETASAPSPADAPASTSAPSSPAASGGKPVDIAPILDEAVRKNGQKLDWRHSIVDMMKALGMDASLSERKELAAELGYTGDTGDSATMNMWLHKALMKKLSENGGKVPAELLD